MKPVKNPHAWSYNKYCSGEIINPLIFNSMVKRFYENEKQMIFEQFCKIANKICVASKYLTARQRKKYKLLRLSAGNMSFYFFDGEWIPGDLKISFKKGKILYL